MGFVATTILRIANSGAEDTLQSMGEGTSCRLPFGLCQLRFLPMAFLKASGKSFSTSFAASPGSRFSIERDADSTISARESSAVSGIEVWGLRSERRIRQRGYVFIPKAEDFPPCEHLFRVGGHADKRTRQERCRGVRGSHLEFFGEGDGVGPRLAPPSRGPE